MILTGTNSGLLASLASMLPGHRVSEQRTCMRPLYERRSCCCLCSSFAAFSVRRCSALSIRFSFLTCGRNQDSWLLG